MFLEQVPEKEIQGLSAVHFMCMWQQVREDREERGGDWSLTKIQ